MYIVKLSDFIAMIAIKTQSRHKFLLLYDMMALQKIA